MQTVMLDYGDGRMGVDLPDGATVVRYGQSYVDPPAIDPVEATRAALRNPLGFPPLRELGGPDKTVVIGFPDRVKGGNQAGSHRKTAIPLILEELVAGGTKLENITLLCAMGLHRKNTIAEWYDYLGKEIVDAFLPDRIVNHDAEAPDLVDYGSDAMGNPVECNRLMAEADLPIVVGHCAGNPYGGYSGGYKMVVTGITGQKSIGSHHAPKTMHRDDWLGASPKQHMRHQFRSIGEAMEAGMGKPFFAVDAVIGQKSQVLQVAAGTLAEVEKATWPLAERRTNVRLAMAEKADVLVMGLPRNFHYGPGMGSNPILMSLAVGGQLSRSWGAFREGGVIIAPAICDGWFNPDWFPSYEPTYELLQKYNSAPEFLASEDARALAHDPGYIYKYRTAFTYHPFHAMSMISGGSVPLNRTAAVIIVGAKAPRYARGMGFRTASTFEEAMRQAERLVGRAPRILATPEAFSGGTAVHLAINTP